MTPQSRLRLVLLFTVAGFFLLTTSRGRAMSHETGVWRIPGDVIRTHNQLSFSQGARDVWYFMEASSTAHDPLTYRLLPDYSGPCANFDPLVGAACWMSTSLNQTGDQHLPFITMNFTNRPLDLTDIEWPARSLFLNPSPTQLAILAWRSRAAAIVRITGSFTQFNSTCGNGIAWSVDIGSHALASGQIGSGAGTQHFDLEHVRVVEDQIIYFTADSLGDYFCDEAPLEVTIATVANWR